MYRYLPKYATINLIAIYLSLIGFLPGCAGKNPTINNTIINPNDGFPASYRDSYTGIEFILLPSGTFIMGSPENEEGRDMDEGPTHKVYIDSFYMGKYEITQGQWESIMGNNPSIFKGNKNLPVEYVSWEDVKKFIKKLNKKTGLHYRLPTEAEWEYACRAGTQTAFCSGSNEKSLNEFAWFHDNSGEETHPVGTRRPNNWGLYDMHGNVSEWVADGRRGYLSREEKNPVGPEPIYRVIHRGGSWMHPARLCRSANRMSVNKNYRSFTIGFRLARDK